MNLSARFGPEVRSTLAIPPGAWGPRPHLTGRLVRYLWIAAIIWGCVVATGCLSHSWGHRVVQTLADLSECGAWVGFGMALRRARAAQIRHMIAILAFVWGARIVVWVAIRLLDGHQGVWLSNAYGILWIVAGLGLYSAFDWARGLCVSLGVVTLTASAFSVLWAPDITALSRWPIFALTMLTYCRLRSTRNQFGPMRLSA